MFEIHSWNKYTGLLIDPPDVIATQLADVMRTCLTLRSEDIQETFETIQAFRLLLRKN